MNRDEAIKAVTQVHAEVDRLTAPLAERHADRLKCARGCTGCCQDDLTVFVVEADRIRADVGSDLAGAAPHAVGSCAFLSPDGACRIYAIRPYVCRTQGLPLRWIDQNDGRERRAICPLNGSPTDLTDLATDACWTLGPMEDRLAGLQVAVQQREGFVPPRRVALRALFAELAGQGGASSGADPDERS